MSARRSRSGFTLIELLVVVSIIIILMALTAFFYPSFQKRETVASGADTTAGALLTAKMRAKRDGKPTGVRLGVNPNVPANTLPLNANQYNMLTYIQQPDDFAVGQYTTSSTNTAGFNNTIPFNGTTNGVQNVNIGDLLELYGGGMLYYISNVSATNLTLDRTPVTPSANVGSSPGTNYRIIRAPQVLTSEPTVNLPNGVIYDFGNQISQLTTSTSGNLDILFAPSGAVVSSGQNAPVFLGLRQADNPNVAAYGPDPTAYYATIIAVAPRTGFIAAYPVSPSGDPFAFTRDGQASGQ